MENIGYLEIGGRFIATVLQFTLKLIDLSYQVFHQYHLGI